MTKFKVLPHTHADKNLVITGPVDLVINYDDCDHEHQDRMAQRVVDTLNQFWGRGA